MKGNQEVYTRLLASCYVMAVREPLGATPLSQSDRRGIEDSLTGSHHYLLDNVDREVVPGEEEREFSEDEMRTLWDSVSRSLIKLGKSGPRDTHLHTLAEMLQQHVLVKVKVNGVSEVGDMAHQLAQGSGGILLQVKGTTMLFGCSSLGPADLLRVAKENLEKTRRWREKKGEAQEAKREVQQASRARTQRKEQQRVQRVDRVIQQFAKGPITKEGLRNEFGQILQQLYADDGSEILSSPKKKASKAPWRK